MRPSRSRWHVAPLLAAMILLCAAPALAADGDASGFVWEGSAAQNVIAKGVDALIVRPLASVRVAVGAALMIPAAILSSPSGREGFDGAYEVLLEQPMEYAFSRPMGEFE